MQQRSHDNAAGMDILNVKREIFGFGNKILSFFLKYLILFFLRVVLILLCYSNQMTLIFYHRYT